jgi:hypothetical protein
MSAYFNYTSRPQLTTRVQRMRALPNIGGHTLFFKLHGFGKSGRFLRPGQVPEFEGEEALFEYEKKAGQIVLTRLVRVTKP